MGSTSSLREWIKNDDHLTPKAREPAAQERNIEVGVLLHDAAVARSLVAQFEQLVGAGHLKSVPGL